MKHTTTTSAPLQPLADGLGFPGMFDRSDAARAISAAFDLTASTHRALLSLTITTRWAVDHLAKVQAKPAPTDPYDKRRVRELAWAAEDAAEAVAAHRAAVDAYLDACDAYGSLTGA